MLSNKKLVVTQSNTLTEAAYSLSLHSKRVLWMCLSSIAYKEDSHTGIFEVSVAKYAKIFNMSVDTAGRNVKTGIKGLANTVQFPTEENGTLEEVLMPWLYKGGLRRAKGVWEIRLHPEIMPYLLNMKNNFTSFDIINCSHFKKTTHIRLYESLMQFKESGIWLTSPSWLSTRYELPKSQQNNFAELERRFLKPVLKTINEHMPIKATYDTRRERGKVVSIMFQITKK